MCQFNILHQINNTIIINVLQLQAFMEVSYCDACFFKFCIVLLQIIFLKMNIMIRSTF